MGQGLRKDTVQPIGALAERVVGIGPEFWEPVSPDELRFWKGEGEDDPTSIYNEERLTRERIIALTERVFADREKAQSWPTTSKDAFLGRAPSEVPDTPWNLSVIAHLLYRIDHGMMGKLGKGFE
jgi:hypothetical protein